MQSNSRMFSRDGGRYLDMIQVNPHHYPDSKGWTTLRKSSILCKGLKEIQVWPSGRSLCHSDVWVPLPTARGQIRARACESVSSDLGLCGGFRPTLRWYVCLGITLNQITSKRIPKKCVSSRNGLTMKYIYLLSKAKMKMNSTFILKTEAIPTLYTRPKHSLTDTFYSLLSPFKPSHL